MVLLGFGSFLGFDTLSPQLLWDKLAADISLSNPCWSRVFNLLAEIRVNIVTHASEAVGAIVQEMIDIDFIRQQMELGVFGWEEWCVLVARVYGILRNVQSADRVVKSNIEWLKLAEQVKDEGPARKFCFGFRFLKTQSSLLQIDNCNARWDLMFCIRPVSRLIFLCHRIQQIAPVINLHGVSYERQRFEEKLRKGDVTLKHTEVYPLLL